MKLTKKELTALQQDFAKHNKKMKQTNNRAMMYKSFDEYLCNLYGVKTKSKKRKSATSSMVVTKAYERPTQEVKSVFSTGHVQQSNTKKKYTGDYVTGITLTHKSNLVPVNKDQDLSQYANMRR